MSLLGMGLTGAVMAAAVIVTRAAWLNRLPKATFVVLWLLVAVRLLVPFSVPVPWNAYAVVDLVSPGMGERIGAALAPTPCIESVSAVQGVSGGSDTNAFAPDGPARGTTALNHGSATLNVGVAAMNGDMLALDDGTTALNEEAGKQAGDEPALNGGPTAPEGDPDVLNNGGTTLNISGAAPGGTTTSLNYDMATLDGVGSHSDIDDAGVQGASDGAARGWLVRMTGLPAWVSVVWVAGSLACAGCLAGCYVRSRRRFAASLPVEDEAPLSALRAETSGMRRPVRLRCSDRVDTPLTYGVFRPVVLLPKGMGACAETRFVLAHEVAHIRRLDLVKKYVLAAALCLHWFNPLVWAMWLLANRDIELACDEAVVRRIGHDARSSYARTLIGMEETRGSFAPLYSAFNTGALEERIVAIMKVKKLSAAAVLASSLLVAGVPAALATTYSVSTDNGPVLISPRVSDGMSEPEVTWSEDVRESDAFPRYSASTSEDGDATLRLDHDGESSSALLPHYADSVSASAGADGISLASPDEGSYASEAALAGQADELTEQLLTSYEAFGLSWGYGRNASYYDDSPWELLMEYEGKDVCSVYDELHDVWIAASLGTTLRANGGIDLMATYGADGKLTGLVECDVTLPGDSLAGDDGEIAHVSGPGAVMFASSVSGDGEVFADSVAAASSADEQADAVASSVAGGKAADTADPSVVSSEAASGTDVLALDADGASGADALVFSTDSASGTDPADASGSSLVLSGEATGAVASETTSGVARGLAPSVSADAASAFVRYVDSSEEGTADSRDVLAWYEQFEPFGLTYDARSGTLTYHDGDARIPVHQFVDEEGSSLSLFEDARVRDGINLRTVRDTNGKLTGLEEFAGEYEIG